MPCTVETSDLFHRSGTDRPGRLTRGNGYPGGEERFERAGYDLAVLLGDDADDGWAA